jgi:hypothetical protein
MTSKPRHGLTEQAADAAVYQACRMLRLPTIRAQFPDLGSTQCQRAGFSRCACSQRPARISARCTIR